MESMDHEQALALLGLSSPAEPDDIEAKYAERRRVLERRWVTSHSEAEKRVLEAQMRELDAAREAALSQQGIAAAAVPAGAKIEFKAGTVLADRYVVRSRIGFGPRGAVFRALDLTWGKDVAVKVIAPQLLLVPGASRRLTENVLQTFGLVHPGIVNIHATVSSSDYTLIAMELVEGRSLAERGAPLAWTQPRSVPEILRILEKIGDALGCAERKTLHLNLTPRNVLVATDKTIKLSDFALSLAAPVLVGASSAQAEDLCFIAPEVVAMTRHDVPDMAGIDARADQYSAAALAYFLATGGAPVPGRKPLGVMRTDLSDHFVTAVERALALAPEARFDSFDDFLRAAKEPLRQTNVLIRRAMGAAILLGAIAVAGTGIYAARYGYEPLRELLPGGKALLAKRAQAEALRDRTLMLRQTLTQAQQHLQRRSMNARTALAAAEQSSNGIDKQSSSLSVLSGARREMDMLTALSDMVVPRVFNGADVLNTYNLMNLSDEHISRGRYGEALALLTGVESVLSAKIQDLRAAELLVERQFGATLPLISSTDVLKARTDTVARLKQEWEAVTEQRRQFAARIEAGMALIPAGTFSMGDSAGIGAKSESPIRLVNVSAFKLGRTEVTQEEYSLCVGVGACVALSRENDGLNENLPVSGISWLDAQQYADWLRVRTGEDYRLPSEAEWEYAARAGVADAYPWGVNVGRGKANCLDCGSAWDGAGPAPVASFSANGFGLYDTVGNLWEWTADCWYRDYTSAPATAFPREGGDKCEKRVLRGGSWDNAAWLARVSYRAFAPAGTRHELYGFRIAKSVN